jgi:biopolymer transport protein TolR
MGMNVGGSGGAMSDINVTPMIDVILVLLIIFMVITPVVQMGYLVRVPPKAPPLPPGAQPPDQIILRYMEDGSILINKEQMSATDFPVRLQQILRGNTGKMVFFAGDPDANYQDTVDFLDLARRSGALNIGLIVEEMGQPTQTELRLATE